MIIFFFFFIVFNVFYCSQKKEELTDKQLLEKIKNNLSYFTNNNFLGYGNYIANGFLCSDKKTVRKYLYKIFVLKKTIKSLVLSTSGSIILCFLFFDKLKNNKMFLIPSFLLPLSLIIYQQVGDFWNFKKFTNELSFLKAYYTRYRPLQESSSTLLATNNLSLFENRNEKFHSDVKELIELFCDDRHIVEGIGTGHFGVTSVYMLEYFRNLVQLSIADEQEPYPLISLLGDIFF